MSQYDSSIQKMVLKRLFLRYTREDFMFIVPSPWRGMKLSLSQKMVLERPLFGDTGKDFSLCVHCSFFSGESFESIGLFYMEDCFEKTVHQ